MLLARDIALGGSKCRGNNDKRVHGGNGYIVPPMNFTLSCNFVLIGSWYFFEHWYESVVCEIWGNFFFFLIREWWTFRYTLHFLPFLIQVHVFFCFFFFFFVRIEIKINHIIMLDLHFLNFSYIVHGIKKKTISAKYHVFTVMRNY